MQTESFKYYAFISYSHKDSAFAEKIAEAAQFLQVASPSQKGKAESAAVGQSDFPRQDEPNGGWCFKGVSSERA